MEKTTLNEVLHFRSNAERTFSNIDLDKKVIYDVILCQVGEAVGHFVHLEQSFMSMLVDYVKKDGKETKCNFDHNYSNMGLQLGTIKDVRLEGTQVKGNLHLFESADSSPIAPGMASFVLAMAQENPKVVNCSIKFMADYYYTYDSTGQKMKVSPWERYYNSDPELKYYVAFKSLESCDLVEAGAVTQTLFSQNTSEMSFAKRFQEFTKGSDSKKKADDDVTALNAELDEAAAFAAGLTKDLEDVRALNTANIEAKTALQTKLDEALTRENALVSELATAKEEIVELGKDAVEKHTDGDQGGDGNSKAFKSPSAGYFAERLGLK
ncbi:MAG: hypothetical protein ABIV51_13805 [Saprospiraceae bacterium]